MSSTEAASSGARDSAPKRTWRTVSQRWPAFAGAAVALLTAGTVFWGRSTVIDSADVVTASALVYLGAAALGIRWSAWPIFGISFVLITVGLFVPAFNPSWIMIAIAAVLLAYGLVRGRRTPTYGLPLQVPAMLILGALALLVAGLDSTVAGVLIAVGLLAHAGWDLYHHRRDRVVVRSMAEFCLVLDTLLAALVLWLTFA